jgi:phosphoglycerate kinase
VLIREDLNVPVADGRITSDAAHHARPADHPRGAGRRRAVMVMSHLGRPKEGVFDAASSLAPVAARLSELLGFEVPLVRDWLGGVDVRPGSVVLLRERALQQVGEKKDDEALRGAWRRSATCS